MFQVGQKVECIRGDWHRRLSGEAQPVRGGVYTIRWVGMADNTVWLLFHEIINPTPEPWFAAIDCDTRPNFRPLIERKTSIEVFERMLPPVTPKKLEPV